MLDAELLLFVEMKKMGVRHVISQPAPPFCISERFSLPYLPLDH